jgi:hypothetical protein
VNKFLNSFFFKTLESIATPCSVNACGGYSGSESVLNRLFGYCCLLLIKKAELLADSALNSFRISLGDHANLVGSLDNCSVEQLAGDRCSTIIR